MTDLECKTRLNVLAGRLIDGNTTPAEDSEFKELYHLLRESADTESSESI